MLNSTVPAVDPAVGYWQWVTSIMHAPETLGFSTCTARAKMWRFNEGSQTLRLHVGPNSKPWTTSRPRSIIMTPGPRPLPETILSGTGKAQGDGSLSRQLCTGQSVCITWKQSNLVHGWQRVYPARGVFGIFGIFGIFAVCHRWRNCQTAKRRACL